MIIIHVVVLLGAPSVKTAALCFTGNQGHSAMHEHAQARWNMYSGAMAFLPPRIPTVE